jgi:hypothetical protein
MGRRLSDPPLDERFWMKVREADDPSPAGWSGCWVWTAQIVPGGYGRFRAPRGKVLAHRFAYEWVVGLVPRGLELDHLCYRPACVNPAHMEPVTHAENCRRAALRRVSIATHCRNGHEYTPENTYRPPGNPTRHCRACRNATHARLYAQDPRRRYRYGKMAARAARVAASRG